MTPHPLSGISVLTTPQWRQQGCATKTKKWLSKWADEGGCKTECYLLSVETQDYVRFASWEPSGKSEVLRPRQMIQEVKR